MRFHIRTILEFTTFLAIQLGFARMTGGFMLGALTVLCVLLFPVIFIALVLVTGKQTGNQLSIGNNPFLAFATRLWIYSLMMILTGILSLYVIALLSSIELAVGR